MNTNNEKGRTIAVGVSVYIVAKCIINGLLGGGLSIVDLLLGVVIFVLMFMGLQYVNYGVAVYLALFAIVNLPGNVSHIGSNWFYLLEGIADILLAIALVTHDDVKGHFTNKWNEIGR